MPELRPVSAFDALLRPIGTGNGVTVRDRDGVGIASVHALPGQTTRVLAALGGFCGAPVADGPVRVGVGSRAVAGVGPGRWLVTDADPADSPAEALEAAVGRLAAVNNQSSGFTMLRLAGPRVGDMLAKGVNIDLHPAVFVPGRVAATAIAHIGVTLWRCPDAGSGPVFEIVLFRSMAGSFAHWLEISAGEFGLAVET